MIKLKTWLTMSPTKELVKSNPGLIDGVYIFVRVLVQ